MKYVYKCNICSEMKVQWGGMACIIYEKYNSCSRKMIS